MVIIDEKMALAAPPPPYVPGSSAPPPFPCGRRQSTSISTLPPNLLLQIIHMTFPQTAGFDEGTLERQRKTLYWLTYHLRLVNRSFYVACMHVLRSSYLPAYTSLIRAPYTSDPFPMSSTTTSSDNPVDTVQRETRVFDLFITLKTREDMFMDASELHLGREELFKDLFDLMQPRSRLEDLVRYYGMREGVVHISSPNASGSSSTIPVAYGSGINRPSGVVGGNTKVHEQTSVPFSALSISFSLRRVGLVLTTSGRKRTISEVTRVPNEKLEVAAKKLVKQLKVWLGST
ncbi:hypothetical protein V8B97DRAFT_1886988 [Scleroderma yunnanense]